MLAHAKEHILILFGIIRGSSAPGRKVQKPVPRFEFFRGWCFSLNSFLVYRGIYYGISKTIGFLNKIIKLRTYKLESISNERLKKKMNNDHSSLACSWNWSLVFSVTTAFGLRCYPAYSWYSFRPVDFKIMTTICTHVKQVWDIAHMMTYATTRCFAVSKRYIYIIYFHEKKKKKNQEWDISCLPCCVPGDKFCKGGVLIGSVVSICSVGGTKDKP